MKILIATDCSKSAHEAQINLGRAGLPEHVEATVLSVADVWLPPEGPNESKLPEEWIEIAAHAKERSAAALNYSKEIAMADAEYLKHLYPTWTVNAEATADSPGWAIITYAERWGADLIVVGSHGHWGLGKLLLGSVSQKVVTHSHCAVRVGRSSTDADRNEIRLLVGMDGSPCAVHALREVKSRNWPPQTHFQLMAVIDSRIATVAISDIPELGFWTQNVETHEGAWIRDILKMQSEELRNAGLKVTTIIKEGDPKHLLVQQANEWKADCIFVGARGLTRIDRFLIGSVSTAVSARAHCSVEVIHRPRK